jgi:hypothetical protein
MTTVKRLQRRFVICPTDKADKNFSIICQNYYKAKIQEELSKEDGAYTTRHITPQQIYADYRNALSFGRCPFDVRRHIDEAIRKGDYKLAVFYWLPKMHKDPPKARFIAASYDVMTTPLARTLCKILTFIKREMKVQDEEHYRATGVRRCWFVNGLQDVTSQLRGQSRPTDRRQQTLNTYDFATMYTTLLQRAIIDSHTYAFEQAFGQHPYIIYEGLKKEVRWPTAEDPGDQSNRYCRYDLMRFTEILVKNQWLKNGEHIKQQTVGLPMGTNPAPQMADLTCFRYEAQAMDKMMRSSLSRARGFAGTCRYIDDIMSRDNPFFEAHVSLVGEARSKPDPIYPPFLALNRTTDSEEKVDYIGMAVYNRYNMFYLDVANTQQRFPVPKVNYPNLRGNFPTNLGYGVYTGQLHRFSRICTGAVDFLSASAKLSNMLQTKGYTKPLMMRTFKRFAENHNPYKTHAVRLIGRLRQLIR